MLGPLITGLGIILAFLIWLDVILLLDKLGILKKYNMSRIWFFALMWRTKKGRGLIEKISSAKKFWIGAANFGFILFFTGMLLMFTMIALSAIITITSPLVQPVGAKEVLVLPGINPYVPFIYGIIGLIVAVVAHELSHGIIARAEGFKVKSLGLLFILIPVGAFMEPDEEEVERGPRKSRMRMFTAGPMSNFILAFLFIGIFSWGFMGSLEAQDNPVIITDLAEDSTLHLALDENPKAIYSIGEIEIHSYNDLYEIEGLEPGNWTYAELRLNGDRVYLPIQAGIVVSSVGDDTPAFEAGIREGSILYSLDGELLYNSELFQDLMKETVPDQFVNLTVLEPIFLPDNRTIDLRVKAPEYLMDQLDTPIGIEYPEYVLRSYQIRLSDKYDAIPLSQFKNKGYIGIASSYLGIAGLGSEEFLDSIAHPLSSGDGFREKFLNVLYITFRLPLELSIMPFHDPLTEIYQVKGPLSALPDGVFWFLANTVFYIFWINILLGLFNALPMIPLDGGFVFRDAMVLILRRFFKDKKEEKLEAWAKKISKYASYTVLILILTSLFFPWLRVLFLA
ncbi:MAG: site-2 protease family protein [Thermoplasmatota archaeon]